MNLKAKMGFSLSFPNIILDKRQHLLYEGLKRLAESINKRSFVENILAKFKNSKSPTRINKKRRQQQQNSIIFFYFVRNFLSRENEKKKSQNVQIRELF